MRDPTKEETIEAALKRLEVALFADADGLAGQAQQLAARAAAMGRHDLERRARCVEADAVARTVSTAPAIEMLRELRVRAEAAGDRLALGRSHALLSTSLDETGDRTGALAEARQAFDLLDESTPLHLRAEHTMVFALVTSLHRISPVSFDLFDRALELSQEAREPVLTIAVLNNKAWLLYENGRLDEAVSCVDTLVATAEKAGVVLPLVVVDTVARLALESGDGERAERLLRDALGADGQPPAPETDISARPAALLSLARCLSGRNETGEATVLLEECWALSEQRSLYRIGAESLVLLAELYALGGDYERAYHAYRTYHGRWEFLRRNESEAEAASLEAQHGARIARQRSAELEQLARRDPLTGLRNRRYLADEVTEIVAETRRRARPLSVALGDIDHFKAVNDRLTHLAGDRVLIVAARLASEVVGGLGDVVRFGGEEFLAVLPGVDLAAATQLATRWCEAMRGHDWAAEGIDHPITVSVGVASLGASDDVASLLDRADRQMYAAKRSGRDRVAAGDDVSSEHPSRRPQLPSDKS